MSEASRRSDKKGLRCLYERCSFAVLGPTSVVHISLQLLTGEGLPLCREVKLEEIEG